MPAHYARVALEGHNIAGGALVVNVLHVEVDAFTSPVNWDSVATDMMGYVGGDWLNLLSTYDMFDRITVTDEDYPGSSLGQGILQVANPGTRSLGDQLLPPALCTVVDWKTNTAKRYARGHTFCPPAYESGTLQTGGALRPASAYAAMVNAFAAAYQNGHTSGSTSYAPIVYSRTQVKKGQTPFVFPVTAHLVSPHIHYLRSRDTSP